MSTIIRGRYITLLIALILMVGMGSAATTEVHIVRYANDGTTVLNETNVTYQWMMDNLPVLGDGVTHYYHQGPVFVDDDNETLEQELRWNPEEDTNVQEKDMGAVKGTNLKDLCDLVGGMALGEEVKVISSDGFNKWFGYQNVYNYSSREGPIGLTWYMNGNYPDTGYSDGMKLVWFADDSVNPWSIHAFGNFDWHEAAAPEYWYYYQQGSEKYPTTTGLSSKYVNRIYIYSNDAPSLAPVAAFTADVTSGTAPLTVQFTDESTGTTPLTYTWDFDNDGTVDSTLKDPSHEYTTAGTYTVNLTVANVAGINSEVKPDFITVNPPLDNTPPSSVTGLANTTFAETSITWTWTDPADSDFEKVMVYLDGVWKQNVTKGIQTWTATGLVADTEYTIGTSTVDTVGNINATTVTDVSRTAPEESPNAQFTASPRAGPAPLNVQFTDQSTGTISSRSWDFTNDGIVDSTLTNPVYTYTSPGNYTVNLTVRGPDGSDTEIKTGYISVKEPASGVSAQFTASPLSGSLPLTVRFADQSTGTISTYAWDFNNDGIIDSRVKNPVTVYTSSGAFTVKLTVRGPDGIDSVTKSNYITVKGFATRPNALFSMDKYFGSAPLTVHFTDKTLNSPDTLLWKFGDGTTSTEKNPTHTYSAAGLYKVSLTASNEAGSSSRAMYVFVIRL